MDSASGGANGKASALLKPLTPRATPAASS